MRRWPATVLVLLLWAAAAIAQTPQPSPVIAPERSVTLLSDPPGAAVYDEHFTPATRAGYIGRTPLTCVVDPTHSHEFYFVLDGYATQKEKLALDQTSLSVSLQPSDPWTFVRHHVGLHPWASVSMGLIASGLFGAVLVRRKRKPMPTPPVEQKDDRRIGDYEIVAPLGEGAFSRVYRARHAEFGDVYALKVMKAEALDADGLARLGREMEIGRDLRHPSLVRVFAFGETHGAPYLVMELVEGRTLEERLLKGPLPVEEVLRIGAEVAAGLAYAHQRGVIHRDLKPSNIVLSEDGRVRVLDFGIARCLDLQKLTRTGVALGTPAYMSPEHARSKVDVRSDVYSLGVVMFEMLTRRTPFYADDAISMMMAHASERVPSVRDLAPAVPAAVDAIVTRMLAKKPARRYQTMEEVVDALLAVGSSTSS